MKISEFLSSAAVLLGTVVAATGIDTTPTEHWLRAAATSDCPCLIALFEPSGACGKTNCTITTNGPSDTPKCYCNPPGSAVGVCNTGQEECRRKDSTCYSSKFAIPCYISPYYDPYHPPPGVPCDNYYWPCSGSSTGPAPAGTPFATTDAGNGQAGATMTATPAGAAGTAGQKSAAGSESRLTSLKRGVGVSIVLSVAAGLETWLDIMAL